MAVTLAVLLDDANGRRARPQPRVGVVLLERTLFDPPRAAACRRWGVQLRRTFPAAALVPYAWHLVTHAPEDRLRGVGKRSLPGEPHAFGHLQPSPEVDRALDVTRTCLEALGTRRLAIRTPPGVSPGAVGRARVRAFVAARAAEGLRTVWEPQGLWSPEAALDAVRDVEVDVLVPALEGGRPIWAGDDGTTLAAPGAWLRVDGSGPTRRLQGGAIDALVTHVATQPEAVLVFAGPRALANLAATAQALELEGLWDGDPGA